MGTQEDLLGHTKQPGSLVILLVTANHFNRNQARCLQMKGICSRSFLRVVVRNEERRKGLITADQLIT
jgi:hypothetical protein